MSCRENDRDQSKVTSIKFHIAIGMLACLLATTMLAFGGSVEAIAVQDSSANQQLYLSTASARLKAPERPNIVKTVPTNKSVKVSWTKSTKAAGYQVRALAGNKTVFKKTFKSQAKTSTKITSLKPSKKYRIQVRAFAKNGAQTKWSKWSKAVTVKTTLKMYKITYQLNGGSQAKGQRSSFKATDSTFTLLEPTKRCCKFIGWFNASAPSEKVASITQGTKHDVNLVAKWSSSHKYETIEYDAPTCAKTGLRVERCETCGKQLETVLPAVESHNTEYVSGSQPTCTSSGTKSHYECKDCGRMFSDSTGTNEVHSWDLYLPAVDHDYYTYTSKSPTCTSYGTIKSYCLRCGKSHTYTTPSLGHNWASAGTTSSYTCIKGHSFTSPSSVMQLRRNAQGNYSYVYVSSCPICNSTNISQQNSTIIKCTRCGAKKH